MERVPYDLLRDAAELAAKFTDVTILDQVSDAFSLVYLGHVVHVQRIGAHAVVHWPLEMPTEISRACSPSDCTAIMNKAVRVLTE